MAECIVLKGGGGADLDVVTAGKSDVLAGKVIVDKEGEPLKGTMPNRGAVNQTLNAGGSYTIPSGYHNGAGKVTANSLASQTPGNADAGSILSGRSAWVNGGKITGSMTNRSASTQAVSVGYDGNSNIYFRVPQGAYLNNVNGIGYPELYMSQTAIANVIGLNAGNIRQGAQVLGVQGIMPDYSYLAIGQTSF